MEAVVESGGPSKVKRVGGAVLVLLDLCCTTSLSTSTSESSSGRERRGGGGSDEELVGVALFFRCSSSSSFFFLFAFNAATMVSIDTGGPLHLMAARPRERAGRRVRLVVGCALDCTVSSVTLILLGGAMSSEGVWMGGNGWLVEGEEEVEVVEE